MITIISVVGAWLICTIAAERAAEAVTTSVLFAPFRQFVARVALADQQSDITWPSEGFLHNLIKTIFRWLSDLISCGWCTSFWTSSFFSIFLPGDYLSINAGDNILVKAIALWGFANTFHSVFRLLHNGRVAAVDVNLHMVDDADNLGGLNGELRERNGQEDAIGVESPAI